jgi:hypothetical protein
MDKETLINLGKELNKITYDKGGVFVPLACKQVKTVAINERDLLISFLEACESVPEDKEGLIPDAIADAFNELINNDPRKQKPEAKAKDKPAGNGKATATSGKVATPATKKEEGKMESKKGEKKAAAPAVKKTAPAPAAKKAVDKKAAPAAANKTTAETKEKTEVDRFGFKIGSNRNLFAASAEEKQGTMKEICGRKWNKNGSMYNETFKKLEEEGWAVKDKDGIITILKTQKKKK